MLSLFDDEPHSCILSAAEISGCGRYRYWLTRIWELSKRRAAFIMLNPSVADAVKDDPTIRRCMAFARSWGAGGVVVVNLFAFRATEPSEMRAQGTDAVGPENDFHILKAVSECHPVVAAWGAHGGFLNRDAVVRELIRSADVQCLGVTKHGQPRHLLYVRADQSLVPYQPEETHA